jgi:hypothetical protein
LERGFLVITLACALILLAAMSVSAAANPLPAPVPRAPTSDVVDEAEPDLESDLQLADRIVLALALALPIEVAVAALLGLRGWGLLGVVVLNLATVPALNAIGAHSSVGVWALEAGVTILEWGLLLAFLERPPWTGSRILLLSASMNLASFLGGFAVDVAYRHVSG